MAFIVEEGLKSAFQSEPEGTLVEGHEELNNHDTKTQNKTMYSVGISIEFSLSSERRKRWDRMLDTKTKMMGSPSLRHPYSPLNE